MNKTTLQSLLLLWDSQGLFQGDGNRVQQYCKSWCLGTESEQKFDLLKLQTLAQNPEVYKAVFDAPNSLTRASESEWQTLSEVPEEEIAKVFAEIERYQNQREEL